MIFYLLDATRVLKDHVLASTEVRAVCADFHGAMTIEIKVCHCEMLYILLVNQLDLASSHSPVENLNSCLARLIVATFYCQSNLSLKHVNVCVAHFDKSSVLDAFSELD